MASTMLLALMVRDIAAAAENDIAAAAVGKAVPNSNTLICNELLSMVNIVNMLINYLPMASVIILDSHDSYEISGFGMRCCSS